MLQVAKVAIIDHGSSHAKHAIITQPIWTNHLKCRQLITNPHVQLLKRNQITTHSSQNVYLKWILYVKFLWKPLIIESMNPLVNQSHVRFISLHPFRRSRFTWVLCTLWTWLIVASGCHQATRDPWWDGNTYQHKKNDWIEHKWKVNRKNATKHKIQFQLYCLTKSHWCLTWANNKLKAMILGIFLQCIEYTESANDPFILFLSLKKDCCRLFGEGQRQKNETNILRLEETHLNQERLLERLCLVLCV